MALYRATKDGNVRMSDEEEQKIKEDWDKASKEIKTPRKTLEQRVKDLETAVELLSK